MQKQALRMVVMVEGRGTSKKKKSKQKIYKIKRPEI